MIKKTFLPLICFFLSLTFFTISSFGADVCVDSASELKSALTDAEDNGESDIIKVVQGTYSGNISGDFSYDSGETYSLTLEGGYTSGCSTGRVVNPANTVLVGGPLYSRVLTLENTAGGDITVEGFTIKNGDAAGEGGGIWARSLNNSGPAGNITLSHNIVMQNSAYNYGGVIARSSSTSGGLGGTVTLTNNTIAGNTASNDYGGVYVSSYSTPSSGQTITLTTNTLTGNSAGNLRGGLSISKDNNTINCYNNIVWGNTASDTGDDIYIGGSGGSAYGYNNTYSYLSGSWNGGSGDNIEDSDPRLSSSYHLKTGSPCIDKGNNSPPGGLPTTDIDGDDRMTDGDRDDTATADIGADEYVPKGILSFFMLLFN